MKSEKTQTTTTTALALNTKLDGFTNVEEMLRWADTVIQSGLMPDSITLPEQVLTIVQHGKELGLTPHIALNNIHVIAGRPVVSSTMLGAMLKRRRIEWTISEDFATIDTPDGSMDKRTTYKFYWKSPITERVMETSFSITWKQMEVAGYVSKHNWQKYPKEMMRARCLSYAVRALFPEVLMGTYTDLEMADVDTTSEYDVVVNEEGDIKLDVMASEVIVD
jgi:hypothetical protein